MCNGGVGKDLTQLSLVQSSPAANESGKKPENNKESWVMVGYLKEQGKRGYFLPGGKDETCGKV